jgi:hypothetical protein
MTRLDVTADLVLSVDGVPATLTGSDGRLVLESADPAALWSAVVTSDLPAGIGRVDGPRGLGRLADGLRDAGVRIDVRGPRGPVASLGAGVTSAVGRVSTGSSALRPGGPRALAPLLLADLRRRRRPIAVAAAVLLGLAGLLRARSRRHDR